MIPGLQVTVQDAAEEAGEELAAYNIPMEWKRISKISEADLPEWVDKKAGGILLYFPEAQFDDAMTILEKLWDE